MAQRNPHLSFKYMEFELRRKHFLTDAAVVTITCETVSFLKTLGCAKKGSPANKVTDNLDKVRSQVQRSVANVKERCKLSRETNFKMVQRVPFSRKPKIFFTFTQRDEQADRNITSLYPLFVDQDEPLTILTTQVENLHVVSHLLHARKRHPRHPNSEYGVFRSFAFAVSKTQGRRNYGKTESSNTLLIKWKTFYDRF